MGTIYNNTACGLNWTSASQRLGKRFSPAGVNQPAPFAISGIPACATVLKAYLWAEGSGNGAAQTATVNGPFGTANYPMAIVGQGPDKCWSYAGSYTYRADVTPSVGGNGTYNISGILTNPPTSGNDMDGATLLVIWSDPTQTYRGTMIIADGAIVVGGGTGSYNMTYPAVCGTATNAQAFIGIGDIQMAVNSVTANATSVPIAWNWWNFETVNTTVATGQTSSNFVCNSTGDCFNLCISGLYYRTTCVACTPTSSVTLTTASTPASCSACNGTATVTASPAGSYTYSWAPTGGTGATATGLCAGTYTVTVTASCGTATATVVVPSSGGSITLNNTSQTNVTCNGSCNGAATVTASGGSAPYTFAWSPVVTNSTTGASNTATGLCAGTYVCTVTDAGGCTGTQTITITQPPAITATQSQVNVTCNGACNGSATVVASGGTGTYTYSWAPTGGTGATASGLCAGTYTCTISSPAGCSITKTFTITQPPAITATQSQVNVTCNGSCNGSATVVASGGTGTYTYSWAPSGGTSATASGLCAGSYTCTISSPAGCSINVSFTITQPPAITATQSQTNVTCNGACNGTATVVASGGNGTYTYAWAPSGGTGATASGLCAGSYTCTISSPAGCSITKTFTITQPPAFTVTPSQVNVTCNGTCNGSATVVVGGGTPPYTYSWAPTGGTGSTTSSLCAGTYTCTYTDAAGCTGTQTFSITQPTAITATTSFVSATCGNANGSATATPSGGVGPYTYLWSPGGQTTQTAINLVAGTYTCAIHDFNGCLLTVTVTVPNAGSPALTVTAFTNVTCNGACNGTATVSASGGTGPYTYNWTPTGGTGTNATGLCPGTYTCTVTDANGCTATATVLITQPPAITATSSQVNVTCNAACNGSATVVASGGTGTYTYAWAPSGGTGATASGLCAGSYTCTISSPAGCSITQTFNITQPPAFTITTSQVNVNCNGACNGSATITLGGGTPPYSYAWSPTGGTGSTASPLCAGTYTCTYTDANGCTGTQTFTITEPTAVTATTSFVSSTCGNANGSATATPSGGVGPYTYLWSPGGQTTQTAINLLAGTYTCDIHDFNGCLLTVTVTVPNAGSPTLTVTGSTNVTCNGACDGTATVSVSGGTGPYTYNWMPTGGTGTTATGLCPGTYTCTVTDANGCTATATVLITEPPALSITPSQVDLVCNGVCNGSATVVAGGGTPPYSYAWSSGGTGSTESSLCAGTYTCTVTDLNGCTLTQTFTITEPTLLTVASAGFNVTCFGACDGQIVAIPSGGTGPTYTFAWSTGCTSASCNNICAGTYNVTVTDFNGCTATSTATVTEPTPISITTSTVDAHCNLADGSAAATFSGGTGTLTPVWYNPSTPGPNMNNIAAGNYFVVVTDQNGCDDTANVTINNIPGVTASAGPVTNVSCFGGNNGSASVNVTGGTGTITYAWSCSPSTTNAASGLTAGACAVTVTDSAGCTSVVNITITEPTALTLSATATPGAICAGQTSTITGTGAGGTPGYNYAWQPNAMIGQSQTVSPAATTTYTVYLSDANSCTDSATVTVTVNPNPVAVFSGDSLAGCAPHCVNFTDNSTIASGTITSWSWDFGDGNTSTSQSPNHCYALPSVYSVTLTITSASGCTNTIVMPNYIQVFALPDAEFTASPQPTTELNPTIYFTDQSSGASTWSWSFGDLANSSSNVQNPSFPYPGPGCFDVILTVTSVNGCVDTTLHQVCIDPDVTLFVPNAFTPNDDGVNDIFRPQGVGIDPDHFEMWIFDRWGNMIFYTDDFAKGWDGIVQGHSIICQQDVYVWKIKALDQKGNKHNIVGHVSLVR
jgi:gliding motility-associated-like protein